MINFKPIKPYFNYKDVISTKDAKKEYINRIIKTINFKEEILLFKEVLAIFINQTTQLKYKDFNKWFSYQAYEEFIEINSKVKIWIDYLFKISKDRNTRFLCIISFETQSLKEMRLLFSDEKLNLKNNYKYISKQHLIELINLKSHGIPEHLKILNKWVSKASTFEKPYREIARDRIIKCYQTKSLELDLSNLQLSDLPYHAFTILTNLKTLNLSNNKLSKLSANTLALLDNIEQIDLSHNLIFSLNDSICYSIILHSIDLSHNNFHSIEYNRFNELPNLRNINLSNNKISQVNNNKFTKSINLNLLNNPLNVKKCRTL